MNDIIQQPDYFIFTTKEEINEYISSFLSGTVANMLATSNPNPISLSRKLRIIHEQEWLEWIHALSMLAYESGNLAETKILQITYAKLHKKMMHNRDFYDVMLKDFEHTTDWNSINGF